MSTSTVNTKYEMEDINGKKLGNSYSVSTGDSVFQTVPNKTITGFGAAPHHDACGRLGDHRHSL